MLILIQIRLPRYVKKYLNIDDNFVVVFHLCHFIESLLKILGIECFGWELEHANTSKTRKINEDIILASWLKNFLSFSYNTVSLEDGQKVLWGNIWSGIINFDSFININSWAVIGGFIEDLTPEGIARISSNIIIGKGDDSILRKSIAPELLIGMKHISLMPVILIFFWTSHKNSPVVAKDYSSKKTYNDSLHILIKR